MAEDSAYWTGTVLGDAASTDVWSAPYSDTEYSDIWSKILASHDNQGFVVAGYNNNLRVYETTPLGRAVNVATGAIFVRGRIYENTAPTTLIIGVNTTGNPRLDRVVVRVNTVAQTIRLAIIAGAAAASPSLPALTQTAATYEVSLAYIWVANGVASIIDEDIHDEREFVSTSANLNDSYGNANLVKNSEFMGFSALSGGATTLPPDHWIVNPAPSDIANYARPAQMSRGRAIQITDPFGSSGIYQYVSVKPSTVYSVKLLVRVTAGDEVQISVGGGAPTIRYIKRTGGWIEEKIYFTTSPVDIAAIVQITGFNPGDIFQVGQVMVIEGYIPGPFRQFHETILFAEAITDANWNTTAKSTGATTITLSADFQALVLPETRGILVNLTARDSGSAAGTPDFIARPFGSTGTWVGILLGGIPNDAFRAIQGMVGLDNSLRFTLAVTATGVGTLDALAAIAGVIT